MLLCYSGVLQDVCDFCHQHLEANKDAFANPKLKLIYDDAKAQLEQHEGTFDVIIADLADPVFGGPCYQVWLKALLDTVVQASLRYIYCPVCCHTSVYFVAKYGHLGLFFAQLL